jgi:hypothetical protein
MGRKIRSNYLFDHVLSTEFIRSTYVFDHVLPKDIQLTIFDMTQCLDLIGLLNQFKAINHIEKLERHFFRFGRKTGKREVVRILKKLIPRALLQPITLEFFHTCLERLFEAPIKNESLRFIRELEVKYDLCEKFFAFDSGFLDLLGRKGGFPSLTNYWNYTEKILNNNHPNVCMNRCSLGGLATMGLPDGHAYQNHLAEVAKLCLIRNDFFEYQLKRLKRLIATRDYMVEDNFFSVAEITQAQDEVIAELMTDMNLN